MTHTLKLPLTLLGLALLAPWATPIPAQTGRFLPLPATSATTVPATGDVNPYGIAFVPQVFAPVGCSSRAIPSCRISTTKPIFKTPVPRS